MRLSGILYSPQNYHPQGPLILHCISTLIHELRTRPPAAWWSSPNSWASPPGGPTLWRSLRWSSQMIRETDFLWSRNHWTWPWNSWFKIFTYIYIISHYHIFTLFGWDIWIILDPDPLFCCPATEATRVAAADLMVDLPNWTSILNNHTIGENIGESNFHIFFDLPHQLANI